ncbi:SUMF1/EgtB/PvdO family nonheme iron enzyme [uncultured Fibrobacter sp.]|uniref:formylglycine-generating enzyme family protein n=1 Tax=uncultured Fibrobacter sp. TaxID=261512 RepID=UPI0025E28A19|nr:SUMF1/EgtB/PvdO family nonheme iron enzyme [uncultured Fibrobacter sp.]
MNLKMMMKKILLNIILIACISCFAQQGLNVYDAEGHLLTKMGSLSELNSKKCPSKRCFVAKEVVTKNGVDDYKKKGPVKSKGHKRWYEVDWNQGVKLCPEKNFNTGEGTWIVNGSAHIDSKNCVYVDGSPYTRSILVLFSRNLDDLTEADSSWMLVNQTIVELAGKSFSVWNGLQRKHGRKNPDSKYIKRTFTQDLIVDKTELRVRDALWMDEQFNRKKSPHEFSKTDFYPFRDTSKLLDFPAKANYLYSHYRSVIDGFEDAVKRDVPIDSSDTAKVIYGQLNRYRNLVYILDTASNGYREPIYEEWQVLRRGGVNSTFLWGDSASEDELKKYARHDCIDNNRGLYPVKQFRPNSYGLYDVYGNAEERPVVISDGHQFYYGHECMAYDYNYYDIGEECYFLSFHKCNAIEKPWNPETFSFIVPSFEGMRLVRKLE